MSIFVVWIDRQHAKLFHFSNEKMERKNLSSSHPEHHTHREDRMDDDQHERKFFGEVARELAAAAQILILGPGVAKHHFQNHLAEHVPALAKKVAGCETVDHPSDAQIAALARRFFRLGDAEAV